MKVKRTIIGAVIGAVLLLMLALAPSASGISVSVSNDVGGLTEVINALDDDTVSGTIEIGPNSLSNSIEGSGSLKESHSVSNKAGANAGVGVDIRNAERYSYDYYLSPDKASKSAPVMASEELDVLNAEYIKANAQAFNAKGYTADVSTVIHDPGNQASLIGYRNIAMASKDEAMASQTAESAFAPNGSIQADSGADFMQLKSHPLRFRWDTADASIRVDSGSVEGYSDLASASAQGIWANQQMDAATGEEIRTKSESASWTASLFQGLKGANAKVTTTAAGNISGYNASARSSDGFVEADQAGHIVGTFTSTALAGKASKTRTWNYGNEYDFDIGARKDASGYYAAGTLGYYVDDTSPVANRIQGAVDASESGDAVNIAPGTYFENVQIDKSLYVNGAGAYDTIVDGQQSGSVFTIGRNDANVDVALSGMTIRGGSGTYTERWPGEPLVQCGGGIWNAGRLSLMDSIVSSNTANEYGSGIWSMGNLTVDRSLIYGNEMPKDGGGIWSSGELTVRDSTVAGNSAYWNGGGIWNSGNMRVERSNITGNIAYFYGGGIANDMGQATVVDSTISENSADLGGGGVYNIFGQVSLDDNAISRNTGNVGGGILNNGDMTVSGGSVSNNNAANGGGIFNMGTMELNGTLVESNSATYYYGGGGGVYNKGTMTINDGTISGNFAISWNGGGIFNDMGMVTMNSGTISSNFNRGIYNWNGIVDLDGGKISGNGDGGIENLGILNMYGGNISGNMADWGGGIINMGTVNMYGGSIDHNIAIADGGGILNYGTVNLNGGSISYNEARDGGGIYNLFGSVSGNLDLVNNNTPNDISDPFSL